MDYASYNPSNKSSSSSTPILITSSSSSYSQKPDTTNANTPNHCKKKTKTSTKAVVKLSTDPQSIAARERRHRISDRFKMLQSLVPGGAKLDTVSMLEQAIQYVKFLKTQIWLQQSILNSNNTSYNIHDQFDHDNYSTYENDAYYYDQYYYALMCNSNGDSNDLGSGGFCSPEINMIAAAPQSTSAPVVAMEGFSGYQGNDGDQPMYYQRSYNF